MKNFVVHLLLLLAVPLVAFAQNITAESETFNAAVRPGVLQPQNYIKPDKKIPFVRCGPLTGRDGIAFGFQGYCEANPRQWFGVYALVGRTGVRNYQTVNEGTPVTANLKNFIGGFGLLVRSPEIKGFLRVGAFGQALYSGQHVHATYADSYQDPESGQMVQVFGSYRDSDRNPLTTVGAQFELRPPLGPAYLVRVGKNFGDPFASNEGHGIYFAAGPVFDVGRVVKTIRHLF